MDRLISIESKELLLNMDDHQELMEQDAASSKPSVMARLKNVLHTMPVAYEVQAVVAGKYTIKPARGVIPPLGLVKVEIVMPLPKQQQQQQCLLRYSVDSFVVKSAVAAGCGSNKKEWFAPKKRFIYSDDGLRVVVIGSRILQEAVSRGAMEEAREMLERQVVDVDSRDSKGWTAMHLAVSGRRAEMVQLLLEFGASPDVRSHDEETRTPLHLAAASGQNLVVELLLAKGADGELEDAAGWRALHHAVYSRQLEVVKLLFEEGADVNAATFDGRTPLHMAVIAGELDCVRFLLQLGADARASTVDGTTSLHLAAAQGHEASIAKLLLDFGAERGALDARGWTAYDEAIEMGQENLLDLLMSSDELRTAAWRGDSKSVRRMLRRGAAVNGQDQFGWTALHCAAFKGHEKIVEYLLDKGADDGALDKNGYTPLNCAAESGHLGVVKLLLYKGRASASENSRAAALDLAMSNGHGSIVRHLQEQQQEQQQKQGNETSDSRGNSISYSSSDHQRSTPSSNSSFVSC